MRGGREAVQRFHWLVIARRRGKGRIDCKTILVPERSIVNAIVLIEDYAPKNFGIGPKYFLKRA